MQSVPEPHRLSTGPVLLLGAGGFIGRAVAERLRTRSVEAIPTRRTAEPGFMRLDRTDVMAVRTFIREHGVRAVIDLHAMTLEDTAPLLAALSGEIARYVLVSSSDVYRNYGGLHRREAAEPLTGPMDEDAPLRASRFPYRSDPPRPADHPDSWLDRYDKIPIEEALRTSGLEHAIVRLPMVYGPGDRQRRFAWIVHRLLADRERVAADRRWAEWRTTYGYVDDVAEAIPLTALHPAAANRTYNVGEAEQPDHLGWIRRFAAALGRPVEAAAIEPAALPDRLRRTFDRLDLNFPLRLDTHRIRSELSWSEVVDPAEALRRTAADETARGVPDGLREDMAAEDGLTLALADGRANR